MRVRCECCGVCVVGKANDVESAVASNCCRLSGLLCLMTGGECECVFSVCVSGFFARSVEGSEFGGRYCKRKNIWPQSLYSFILQS